MPRARRSRPLAVLALALALVAFPLGALASHDFADVPDSNLFHADISALVDAGVTSGCGGGNYCPSANVTREQMAAFLNRLGALAPGKTPVVNADKVDGLDSHNFLQADEVVISQLGPVHGAESYSPTITYHFDKVRVASDTDGYILVPLSHPEMIGGRDYGLLAVDICYLASANLSIDDTSVFRVNTAGYSILLGDSGDYSTASAGCYTLSGLGPVDLPGAMYLTLYLNFSASSQFDLVGVTTHWLPT